MSRNNVNGFKLGDVTKKARRLPNRIILHGVAGWGKTSFAAQIPEVLFLMVGQETGLWTLMEAKQVPEEVAHFPEPVVTLPQLLSVLQEISEGQHSYRALVIDAITWIEDLLSRKVCSEKFGNDWGEYNEFGADKANKLVAQEWDSILFKLNEIREKGIGVFLISHSKVVKFNNPEGPDYDRWQSLTKYSWDKLFAWSDITLFGSFETRIAKRNARKNDAETKGKASGGQVRVLHTERHAAFDAKHRHGLPSEIECGSSPQEAWENFITALKK